jgi:hypothetical protein
MIPEFYVYFYVDLNVAARGATLAGGVSNRISVTRFPAIRKSAFIVRFGRYAVYPPPLDERSSASFFLTLATIRGSAYIVVY